MSVFLEPTVISAGLKFVGSLLGGNDGESSRDNRIQQEKLIRKKPQMIREGAERAGFNPLTYMMSGATGSSVAPGTGGNSPLASWDALASVVDAVGAAKDQIEADNKQQETAKRQLERVAQDQRQSGAPGNPATETKPAVSPETVEMLGEPARPNTSLVHTRPVSRFEQGVWGAGAVPVYDITGKGAYIPQRVADRLKLKAGDTLIMEDYEAVYGDEAGQVIALPKLPSLFLNMEEGHDSAEAKRAPPSRLGSTPGRSGADYKPYEDPRGFW